MGKTAGTDESVFRQVPVPGNGARVLPLKSERGLRMKNKIKRPLILVRPPEQAPHIVRPCPVDET